MHTTYDKEFPALYRGVVENNIDPEDLGRCKIRVPAIHGALTYPVDLLPWARPLVLSPVKTNRGSVSIPDIGDIVWVLFEGANRNHPVYFGGTYGKNDNIDISLRTVDIYMEDGNKISYDRTAKIYKLSVGSNRVEISPVGINIVGNTTICGNLKVLGTIDSTDCISANVGETQAVDLVYYDRPPDPDDEIAEEFLLWDRESVMNQLGIKAEDLESMTLEEKNAYLFCQKLIANGTDPAEIAAAAAEAGIAGNGLTGGYCQAFCLWYTRIAQGKVDGVAKYQSAMDCMNSGKCSDDFSNIPIGATIVGDSSYTPSYGHAVVYVGDGNVMHVVDTGEVRYQSLEDLVSEGWFTPQGWTNLCEGDDSV